MKIYIFVDMEGISGISGSEFVKTDGRLYGTARCYYTGDLNVCARACFKAAPMRSWPATVMAAAITCSGMNWTPPSS